MSPPFTWRQFVWCQFPYMEEPLRPGPKEHVAYVADVRRIGDNPHLTVMSLYTTTRPWEPGIPLPLGIIPVEADLARKMNQKAFVLDARRVAFLPLTAAFFPRLRDRNKGVLHIASDRFHTMVEDTLLRLARRPELVARLGPDVTRPARTSGKARRPR